MGKNALEKIGTAIIISIISIGLTTVVTRRTLIDGKLDKSEYYRDQDKHELKHIQEEKDMREYFDTRFDDLKEFMIELNKD